MKKIEDSDNLPTGIPKPALRALEAAGISKLEDFKFISEKELLKLHGMGPKAIRLISEVMDEAGLHFAKDGDSRIIGEVANKRIERRE